MQVGEGFAELFELDLFANEVMVQVLQHLLAEPGIGGEPEQLVFASRRDQLHQDGSDNPGLRVGEERFAAGARGQSENVVGAEIV
jgi:hypothetical protein